MYITTILDKYQVIYLDYMNGSASTRVSVPMENRKSNTILSYLDYNNLLHIELFIGTEANITDEEFAKDTNWITAELIYMDCYNVKWDTDWNTTIKQINPENRAYRMVVTTVGVVEDECGEESIERITQRYSWLCATDENYYNEENWVLYDYNIIIKDVMNIITELMTEVEKYDYQIDASNANN